MSVQDSLRDSKILEQVIERGNHSGCLEEGEEGKLPNRACRKNWGDGDVKVEKDHRVERMRGKGNREEVLLDDVEGKKSFVQAVEDRNQGNLLLLRRLLLLGY